MKTYQEWSNDVIMERWESTGLLEGTRDKKSLANLLEGQFKYNESSDMDAQFKLISIPLVRRIFESSVIEGAVDILSHWHTFQGINWAPMQGHVDTELDKTAEIADDIVHQLRSMGHIAVHCLKRMEDGSIAMNYQ